MSESRLELLSWLNGLLKLNYTKIEQLGTGAAYCQIFDSIYGDVQMHRVKFDTKQEYEYVGNFKVLQQAFDTHRVDKTIPVERLMKCKFQDNIEFCQWVKKFHDTYFPGGNYDPLSRRKGGGSVASASFRGLKTSTSSNNVGRGGSLSGNNTLRSLPGNMPRSNSVVSNASASSANYGGGGGGTGSGIATQRQVADLTRQLTELTSMVEGLEKERDFYFGKLRDIEMSVQQTVERDGENDLTRHLSKILYSTEEGFEIPSDTNAEEVGEEGVDDMETF